jgi:hypothetical protein
MATTADLLNLCLDEIASGAATLDGCLASHPDQAADLRALLQVALSIPPPPPAQLDPAFRAHARVVLLETIRAERRNGASRFPVAVLRRITGFFAGVGRPSGARQLSRGFVLGVSLVILATIVAGSGAIYASQGAIPGDALYPIKTAVEQIELKLTTGDDAQAQAYVDLAGRRADEVQNAVRQGRSGSAGTAAAAYVHDVEDAGQHLSRAAAAGNDVSALTTRLTGQLERQRAGLSGAGRNAPIGAREAVDRAVGAANGGLDTGGNGEQHAATPPPVPAQTATDTATTAASPAPIATIPLSRPPTTPPRAAAAPLSNLGQALLEAEAEIRHADPGGTSRRGATAATPTSEPAGAAAAATAERGGAPADPAQRPAATRPADPQRDGGAGGQGRGDARPPGVATAEAETAGGGNGDRGSGNRADPSGQRGRAGNDPSTAAPVAATATPTPAPARQSNGGSGNAGGSAGGQQNHGPSDSNAPVTNPGQTSPGAAPVVASTTGTGSGRVDGAAAGPGR